MVSPRNRSSLRKITMTETRGATLIGTRALYALLRRAPHLGHGQERVVAVVMGKLLRGELFGGHRQEVGNARQEVSLSFCMYVRVREAPLDLPRQTGWSPSEIVGVAIPPLEASCAGNCQEET